MGTPGKQGLKLLPARKIISQLPQQLQMLQLPPLEQAPQYAQLPAGAAGPPAGGRALPQPQQQQLGPGAGGGYAAPQQLPQQGYAPQPPPYGSYAPAPQGYPPQAAATQQVNYRPSTPPVNGR